VRRAMRTPEGLSSKYFDKKDFGPNDPSLSTIRDVPGETDCREPFP
jgi:hypothetical protein